MKEKLSLMIQNAVGGCAKYWADVIADKLIAEGVIVPPCKVGSTMYRIDTISVQCSHLGQFYDEYYCSGCRHLLNGNCDAHKKPYLYEMKNVNAQTIFGNEHLIGTRVFLTKEEAEKALAERSKENATAKHNQ